MKKKILSVCIALSVVTMLFSSCSKSTAANHEITSAPDDKAEAAITLEPTKAAEPTAVPTVTPTPEVSQEEVMKQLKETSLDRILKQEPEYKSYQVNVIEVPKQKSIVYLFATPDSDSSDFINYCVDIWLSNEKTDTMLHENTYILPDTYGTLTIGEDEYVRYDYAYASESQTVLLYVIDGEMKSEIVMGAFVEASGNEVTATLSSYDSLQMKGEEYACGHTWKPYYCRVEKGELTVYEAVSISEEEFLKYPGAEEILKELDEEYACEGVTLSYEFLLRENGKLHINILSETETMIGYNYVTYDVQKDNTLLYAGSGEGRYGN